MNGRMDNRQPLRSILIVGGGTAGWSAAALLSSVLAQTGCKITLIESSEVATVGVGEATIPPVFEFLANCGIDEVDFIRHCQATFKLAIRFDDWLEPGHRYWHPFGNLGVTINQRPFHHYWWKNRTEGHSETFADLCPAIALAEDGKFAFPPPDGSFPGGALNYALHFDAGLVAHYLRSRATDKGTAHIDARIRRAIMREDGAIAAVELEDGQQIAADFFIDCSGFRGLLIEDALHAGYEDWTHWLPCDRAVAMPTETIAPPAPYTIAAAHPAGWRWRIPLQLRVGNGYVYSSRHVTDDAAAETLRGAAAGAPLADPRFLRFTAGRRKSFWVRNCLAVGLSSGFLEPLESTSIHLIHTALNRLLDYFPDSHCDPVLAAAYNRETADEYAHIRDFLLLHYLPNRRIGEPFWDEIRTQTPPDSLAEKLELFRRSGRIVSRKRELFADISWFFVAAGMGIVPGRFDPLADAAPFAEVRDVIGQMSAVMQRYRAAAPTHAQMLARLLDPAQTRRPSFAQKRGER
jgi:tryptophan halogenase